MGNGRGELPDRNLINESYSKDPGTLWVWVALVAAIVALMWGGSYWISSYLYEQKEGKPFLQVTNRQMSLYLWQNPESMRIHATSKSGYLPAFNYLDKVNAEPKLADQLVVAPPGLLFRYHSWDRLLKSEFIASPILADEFAKFLDYDEQWKPEFWPAAPKAYSELVSKLEAQSTTDLASLPETTLPRDVRLAFQGWKNYTMEGDAINQLKIKVSDVAKFLNDHPHYCRSYWRNIVDSDKEHYLKTFIYEGTQMPQALIDSNELLPLDQTTAFLRVALFNALSHR